MTRLGLPLNSPSAVRHRLPLPLYNPSLKDDALLLLFSSFPSILSNCCISPLTPTKDAASFLNNRSADCMPKALNDTMPSGLDKSN